MAEIKFVFGDAPSLCFKDVKKGQLFIDVYGSLCQKKLPDRYHSICNKHGELTGEGFNVLSPGTHVVNHIFPLDVSITGIMR